VAKLALVMKNRTQPGKRDEIFQLFKQHLAPRAESNPDQEIEVCCADDRDPDAFYLFEVHRDRAAFEANSQAPWFGEFMAAAGLLLADRGEVALCTHSGRR
jgi:quinol monooxygenase YgiN